MFSPTRTQTSRRHGEAVALVLLHIEEHLEESLSLSDLAAVAGFAPHHFHRVFGQVTGETPKEYVRRLRLERSVYRMKISPDDVLQIATGAGFATSETFTRAFARHFDLRPSEFRRVLKDYRGIVAELPDSGTFEGYADETPLTLRFDMRRVPVTIQRTPGRHLLFVRHHGYEHLLAPGQPLIGLWDDVLGYAATRGVAHSPDTLIAITHDDPYVTDEARIRFDACIEVTRPVTAVHPVMYRWMPPGLAVARRHGGGLEEVAKTFAHIGVDWLTSRPYALATAPPFMSIHLAPVAGGEPRIGHAVAYVPLDMIEGDT